MVAGDIGPSGGILAPLGDLERDDAVKGFAEQAAALHAGGVDVFWIETMSALEEVEAAVEGVRQAAPGAPIVVTMSFDTHGHTMMGVGPEEAAKELTRARRRRGRRQLRARPGGAPARDGRDARRRAGRGARREAERGAAGAGGRQSRLPGKPEEMADYARRLVAAGVRVVGGCCGSAPAHLRAMAQALEPLQGCSREP